MAAGNSVRKRCLAAAAAGMMMAGATPAFSTADNPATHGMAHGATRDSHAGGPSPDAVRVMPVLAGQDAFAAIQEIVAILEADPQTDWSRVDLDALRRHLVDMNALVLGAESAARDIPGGVQIVVDAAGPAGAAARRMVPAHAGELAKIAGWTATAETDGDGRVILRVIAADPEQVVRIRGLGFFGLMATGAHHQQHHLAVARGGGMHR